MKHLRKYNEDVDEVDFDHMQQSYKKWEENGRLLKIKEDNDKVIKDYIKDCFIEFIDKGAISQINDGEDDYIWYIEIKLPDPTKYIKGDYIDIETFMKYNKELNDTYSEIEYALEKVKLKYDFHSHILPSGSTAYSSSIDSKYFEYFSDIFVYLYKKEISK